MLQFVFYHSIMRMLGEDDCAEMYVPQVYLGQFVVSTVHSISVYVYFVVCACVLEHQSILAHWWGKYCDEQMYLLINPDPSLYIPAEKRYKMLTLIPFPFCGWINQVETSLGWQ